MFLCKQSWRWYGPDDPVSLSDIRQAGATEVVHALHHIPNGEVWPVEEIRARQQLIAGAGLTWSVVRAYPFTNTSRPARVSSGPTSKTTSSPSATSPPAASSASPITSCPFWTGPGPIWPIRSKTVRRRCASSVPPSWPSISSSSAVRGAWAEYSEEEQAAAKGRFDRMDAAEREQLTRNMIAGLPGRRRASPWSSSARRWPATTGWMPKPCAAISSSFCRRFAP